MTYRREIGTGARRFLLALLISHFSFHISFAQEGRKYDAFFLDAVCQQEKGNLDAAFDLLSHCVEIDSTRSEAHYYLGKYYMAMKQKDKALAHATRAAQIEPDNATYQETLANMYIGNHQYDKATAALERLYATNRVAAGAESTDEEKAAFAHFIDNQLAKIQLDKPDVPFLRERLITMYANPFRNAGYALNDK